MLVEQINYEIEWKHFRRGMSFFIPCLDPLTAKRTIRAPLRRLGIRALLKTKIEDGVMGVRVWRL
jgi:hypothetical protein